MMSAISHNSFDNTPLFSFQNFIDKLIKAASDIEGDVKSCNEIRDARKLLEKATPKFIDTFININQEEKIEFEEKVISLKNKARYIINKIENKDLQFKHSLTKTFVLREMRLYYKIFTHLHDVFTSHLYTQPALIIPYDHELTKKLIQSWGEHSFKDC